MKSNFHETLSYDDVEGSIGLMKNAVVIAAVKGDLDLNLLASYELANRGLNGSGIWVGFDEAKRLHSARVEKKEWVKPSFKTRTAKVKQLEMEAEDMAAENRRLEAENTRLLKAAGKLK